MCCCLPTDVIEFNPHVTPPLRDDVVVLLEGWRLSECSTGEALCGVNPAVL